MANRTPEQDLINQFIGHLQTHEDDELKIATLFNKSCKAKKYSDIEYRSVSNIHWVIEAKSHDSGDRYNTVHKIYGELLKETGRVNRNNCCYGILIPSSSVNFYSRAFQFIQRDRFLKFGQLIPVDCVFLCNEHGFTKVSWEELYDSFQP